ncbi:MAG: SAM-dependent chlorinase/fluorinase [Gemmatimonadota bacterium]|nr:SAM-dependent chlorinase/fluorinase [Gemmatimonadota bacterium]
MNKPIITLLTDFGQQDGFVGAMKGVVLGINPEVSFVDITHEVPPQDVEAAAYLLRNAYTYFPDDTIHVAVVDPGVGTDRAPIIVETDRYRFVGPDNGIFAYVYQAVPHVKVTCIDNPEYCLPSVSHTFHGRDVFASVAAHLSRGVQASVCGPEIDTYLTGGISTPHVTRESIHGEAIHIDRFGNVVTNISEDQFFESTRDRSFRIEFEGLYIDRLSVAYGDTARDGMLAVIGSAGMLEISINGGNAAQQLGLARKSSITVVMA